MATAAKDPSAELLKSLFYELFQTERSAEKHTLREAERLGSAPPARALVRVAEHAEAMKPIWQDLAQRAGFAPATAGKAIGDFFSELRERVVDHTLHRERSYRMTLVGMRHGVDLVRSMFELARRMGRSEIEHWCRRWLLERQPLVDAVAVQLSWFAEHPAEALEPARPLGLVSTARRANLHH